jgi:hypothetical protein
VEKPKGNRPLGNLRSAWENNIKMDLKVRGWKVLKCVHLAKNRDKCQDVKKVISLRVP